MRTATVERKTRETEISATVTLEATGVTRIRTRLGFLTHLLDLLGHHSLCDLEVSAEGDLLHHIVEDTALTVGEAIHRALGNREGICRFGWATVPLDDALASASVDLARRPYAVVDLKIERDILEDMPREDIYHFVRSLATALEATVHVVVHYGQNDHHKVEAGIKALALALRQAVALDPRRTGVPSSKGVI